MGDSKSTFDIFDKDGDGAISKDEVGIVARTMGYVLTNSEAEELGNQCADPNRISQQEFQQLLSYCSKVEPRSAQTDLMEAMKVFDKEDNGMIKENELRTIFTQLGETITADEIDSLISQVKIDEYGRIKYAEFISLVLK